MSRRATIGALLLAALWTAGCQSRDCVLPGCGDCDPCWDAPCDPSRSTNPCVEAPDSRMSTDWVTDLRSSDRAARDRAVDALALRGAGIIRDVGPLLSDPDPAVRFSAMQVFVRLREDSYTAVWYVKNRLTDSDAAIRADAAYVIGMAGQCSADALPELVVALRDRSPYVRYRAAVAFQSMHSRGTPAISALERAARCDRDPRVREAAECALFRIEKANCNRDGDAVPY